MRQQMQRQLHSRTGHGFKKRKMCNVRIPRSKITLVASRFEKEISNKSTWITAIKNGNFTSWPGLTEHAVEKHLSKSTSTTKDHLNQQRQNARTTIFKDTKVIVTAPDLDHGIQTQFVYAATIDAGQIYTDQTGRFPVVSSKVNKYIMILYDYDSNAILAQPIKDRTASELLKPFKLCNRNWWLEA
jgi:hypothetical protein